MRVANFTIGEMRSVVKMLKNVPVATDTGGAVDAYGIIVTTRGRLRRQSGFRNLSFGEVFNSESYELIMYYQNNIAAELRTDTKFLIDNLIYTINSWDLVDDIKDWYRIRISIDKGGSVTIIAPTPIPGSAGIAALWLTTVDGTFTVSSALLTGATILGVTKSGLNHELVAAPPGNFQVSFSGTTLTFDIAFNTGEIVYVLYST